MSKYLFGLLLAGVAAPVLAAGPHDHHRGGDDNSPRQENRAERPSRGGDEARPQRAERPQAAPQESRGERPQFAGRPDFAGQRPQVNRERPQFTGERPQFAGRPQVQAERPQWNGDRQRSQPVMRQNPDAQGGDSVRDWRPREQVRDGTYYQQRQVRSGGQTYTRDNQWRSTHDGRPQTFRFSGHRESRIHWDTRWRNDHRYDWRERRRHNRSLFHLGLYIDPFGWGYQPYSIGYDLYPGYYQQQNYWIDPALYGLPYPPPGTQWIRYYNDALLIDMYSGQIVDALQNFFW